MSKSPQDRHKFWFRICREYAAQSKDKHTKTGAVIVTPPLGNVQVAAGYNGFVRGADDDRLDRYERPEKYFWSEHAERNAIYSAVREGVIIPRGCIMYSLLIPCMDCARAIVQVGIKQVIVPRGSAAVASDIVMHHKDRTLKLFREVGVTITQEEE